MLKENGVCTVCATLRCHSHAQRTQRFLSKLSHRPFPRRLGSANDRCRTSLRDRTRTSVALGRAYQVQQTRQKRKSQEHRRAPKTVHFVLFRRYCDLGWEIPETLLCAQNRCARNALIRQVVTTPIAKCIGCELKPRTSLAYAMLSSSGRPCSSRLVICCKGP